jgi:tRNA nucleotidyltransferase (CCA-adding enzyme)
MKDYLKRLPREVLELIYSSRTVASKNNMHVYLVGGFVRDLLLGVKNFDLDIVVEGDGLKFAEDYATMLKGKLVRHRRFGTATIILRHNLKIDIATARREIYPQPASLPVVTRSNLKDDLARRDFTINAMAISVMDDDFGRLIDFFEARNDLADKKIRVLHALSFIDDPTRILRAIRFEGRYNFRIEAVTLRFLKESAKLKMLEKVEPQRLRDELILILKEEEPLKELRRIKRLFGFSFINPRLFISKSDDNLLSSIERQIHWFKKSFPERRQLDTWIIYFMGLTSSLQAEDVENICTKFVFRRGEEKIISSYRKIFKKLVSKLSRNKVNPAEIFHLLEPLSYEVTLFIKAKYKNHNLQKHIADFFEIYNGMKICISGDDLRRLGVIPGPFYQKVFTKVLNAKLEGLVKTKDDELVLIKRLLGSK